jgi:hypothetical protein
MKKILLKITLILFAVFICSYDTLAQCPTTITTANATSGNSRCPSPNFRFSRVHYIVTAAEMAAAGFVNGDNIANIWWQYTTIPSIAVSGTLAVYFENSADAVNTKSTSWATAVASMTNSRPTLAYTLPNSLLPFNVPITAPFTYTGGSIYVAFEWSNPANPLATGTVTSSSIGPNPGLFGSQSNVALPATLAGSTFRGHTFFSKAAFANDAKVDYIYQNGKIPLTFSANEAYGAKITNVGLNALTNVPVSLNITGANTHSPAAVVIASLAACSSAVVNFASFTSTSSGANSVSVSIPADDGLTDNTKVVTQTVTANLYDTRTSGQVNAGGVGFNGGSGSFVGKFSTTIPALVNEVQVDFTSSGNPYRLGIYAADGPSGSPGTLLYTDAADRTTAIGTAFAAITPAQLVPAGDFYVGIRQVGITNVAFQYSIESPITANKYFFNSPQPEPFAGPWSEFNANALAFRLNIGVQFYIPAPPNCALSMLPADLDPAVCNGTNLTWNSGGGGPTGYRLTFGTNAPNYDNIENNTDLGNVTSYTPTLASNTTYGWKVVPYNVDGPATGCAFQTFTTGTILTLPFTEDFSSLTFPPQCWTLTNSSVIFRANASNAGVGTGSAQFDFFNAAVGNYDFHTPVFSPTPAGYLLTFNYAYATFATEIDQLELFTSSNGGTSYSSLILLNGGPAPAILNTGGAQGAAFVPTAGQWGTYQILIPTGTNKIRFRGISAFGNNLYLDNISVDAAPPIPGCAVSLLPADLSIDQARDNTVSWSPGSGTPTGYDVYLGTNQTDVLNSVLSTKVSSNQATTSYMASNLLANTQYYWKVVPKNFTGDAVGCGVQSFTTGVLYNYCLPAHAGCGAGNITNVTFGTINSTTTCSGAAYIAFPAAGPTTVVPQGYNVSLSVTTDAACIISCWIDYDQDGLFEASEWTQVTTSSASNVASTIGVIIDPLALLGPTKMRIRSRFTANPNGSGDACSVMGSGEAEDYVITVIAPPVTPPLCTTVTVNNAACVSATSLSWPAAANFPTSYDLYFGTDGGGVTQPTNVFFASNLGNVLSVALPALSPVTQYYYQIVPKNANGDAVGCIIGGFVSGASVAFTPTIANPYVQNFDGVTQPNLPCGITRADENFPADGFTWVTSTLNASSLPNSMAIGYNSSNTTIAKDDWFFSVPLNLTAGKLYRGLFKYAASTAAFPEAFEIFISSAPDAATMTATASVYTKNNITNTTYIQDQTADYIPLLSGVYYIGIHANSTADQDILFIDDLSLINVPVSALSPSSCTTVNSMYTPIYCDPYPGATNYKYKIENLASSFSYEFTRNLALTDFRLKWAPGVTFATSYDVSVSAFVGGVWTPYGPTCVVSTGPFPTTKLTAVTSCGATISSLSAQLTCDSVSGANDYEYRIVNVAQSYDHVWRRITSATDYRLSWAYSSTPLVQGLQYGFTYDIQVRALVGKTSLLPGQWGTFGPVCQVTVTGTPQTQLTATFCGATLLAFTSPFNCIPVAGASDYEWRVSNITLGYSQTGTRTNSNTNYQLNWLPGAGGGIRYATTYDVEVRAKVGGVFGSYGTVCQLTTPASPLTSLQLGFCSNYLLPTFSSQVFSTAVPGATNYRYHITGPFGYDKTFTRNSSLNDWRFNWTILAPPNQNMVANQTYTVEVASYAGGVWSAYGGQCTIVTPAVVPRYGTFVEENPTLEEAADLSLTVQPNPASASNLSIVMEGIREANTQVQVSIYSMIGKKVYSAEITTDEQSRLTLRPETMLAPGVYMTEAIVNGRALRHKFVVE